MNQYGPAVWLVCCAALVVAAGAAIVTYHQTLALLDRFG